jgi:hypothetical protein
MLQRRCKRRTEGWREVGEAIGQMLPTAVAVMLNPTGIVVVILILVTGRGRVNGPWFLVGWLASLAAVGTVMLLIAGGIDATEHGAPATWVSLLLLVLGVLLLLVALKLWRDRPREGDPPKAPPKWMSALDRFTPLKAAGTGVLLGGLNPKNLLLIVAGAAVIAQTGISTGQQIGAFVIFVVIASLGIAIPVVLYFAGDRSRRMLDELEDWMARNSAVIIAVVLVILGVKLIGDAISGISA